MRRKGVEQRLYPQLQLDESLLEGISVVVGDKNAVQVLLQLEATSLRFSEIELDASSKTLSSRLKLLEYHGLISRTIHAEVPPRVEYAITTKGAELVAIIKGLLQWEQSWQQKV